MTLLHRLAPDWSEAVTSTGDFGLTELINIEWLIDRFDLAGERR